MYAAAAQQAPVFRSLVDLASLDVTVTNGKGEPVVGLRSDEFVVTINDRPASIELLQFVAVDSRRAVAPEGGGATSSPDAAGTSPFRVVVFLVDDLSMPAHPLQEAMQPALEMLSMLGPDDVAGVVSTSGLGPVVNPTRDRSAVKAALLNKNMTGRALRRAGRFVIGAQEAVQVEEEVAGALERLADRECLIPDVRRKDPICEGALEMAAKEMARSDVQRSLQQLQAIERVVNALRGGPSPKILVVISSGLTVRTGLADVTQRIDALSRVAASAGVIIYGLGKAPEFASVADTSSERSTAIREEAVFLNSGLQTAVEATGGQSFLVVGQPKRFVQRIMSETSAFYRLGVRIPPESRSGALRVRVTTTRQNAIARANRHLIPPAGGGTESVPRRMRPQKTEAPTAVR
ncbi:MAG TPA: VWA domain-containing protein [Vicinamibacterales bacterium]|nr:VWA domain-containing protein [Vicinamibacterales bacterium]